MQPKEDKSLSALLAEIIEGHQANMETLASVSQWEREIIGQRTKDAIRYLKEQKQAYSRPVYGFDCSTQGEVIENHAEAKVIEHMRELKRQDLSYLRIAGHLNEQGVPTKRGDRWWDSTVRGILLNCQ